MTVHSEVFDKSDFHNASTAASVSYVLAAALLDPAAVINVIMSSFCFFISIFILHHHRFVIYFMCEKWIIQIVTTEYAVNSVVVQPSAHKHTRTDPANSCIATKDYHCFRDVVCV